MIALTRISGSVFVLNCDLIERVDSTPDTIVTLVDGKKYVVLEHPYDVVRLVRQYRGEVIATSRIVEDDLMAERQAEATPADHAHLSTVSTLRVEG